MTPSDGRDTIRFEDREGRSWLMRAALAAHFEAQILPHLEDLSRAPGATVVKDNRARTVVRLPGPGGGEIFAKRYRLRSSAERWKYVFLASRARSEWHAAERLTQIGVPCAAALAMAERRSGPFLTEASYFCEGLRDVVPFGTFLETRFRPDDGRTDDKLRCLEPVLGALATLHQAGIYHSDFHGGNLLARANGDGAPSIFLVDLHSIHDPGALFTWMRMRDLSDLMFSLRFALSGREQREAALTYGRMAGVEREVARRIDESLVARARRHVASRSKRCFKESSVFTRSQIEGEGGTVWSAHHRRDLPSDQVVAILRAHAHELQSGGPAVLSLSARSRVTAVANAERTVVVKEFLHEPAWLGRARRAYQAAHSLEVRGVPAPAPLAYVRGVHGREFVISALVSDAVPLTYAIYRLAREADEEAPPARARLRRQVARALAGFLARLVRAGVDHTDLSAKNVLVARAAAAADDGDGVGDGDLALTAVDLEAVRFRRVVSESSILRGVVQLGDLPDLVTPSDRLRFVAELRRELPKLGLRPHLRALGARIDARVFRHGTARRTRLVGSC